MDPSVTLLGLSDQEGLHLVLKDSKSDCYVEIFAWAGNEGLGKWTIYRAHASFLPPRSLKAPLGSIEVPKSRVLYCLDVALDNFDDCEDDPQLARQLLAWHQTLRR